MKKLKNGLKTLQKKLKLDGIKQTIQNVERNKISYQTIEDLATSAKISLILTAIIAIISLILITEIIAVDKPKEVIELDYNGTETNITNEYKEFIYKHYGTDLY